MLRVAARPSRAVTPASAARPPRAVPFAQAAAQPHARSVWPKGTNPIARRVWALPTELGVGTAHRAGFGHCPLANAGGG